MFEKLMLILFVVHMITSGLNIRDLQHRVKELESVCLEESE